MKSAVIRSLPPLAPASPSLGKEKGKEKREKRKKREGENKFLLTFTSPFMRLFSSPSINSSRPINKWNNKSKGTWKKDNYRPPLLISPILLKTLLLLFPIKETDRGGGEKKFHRVNRGRPQSNFSRVERANQYADAKLEGTHRRLHKICIYTRNYNRNCQLSKVNASADDERTSLTEFSFFFFFSSVSILIPRDLQYKGMDRSKISATDFSAERRGGEGKEIEGFERHHAAATINYPWTSGVIAISKVRRPGSQLWSVVRYC